MSNKYILFFSTMLICLILSSCSYFIYVTADGLNTRAPRFEFRTNKKGTRDAQVKYVWVYVADSERRPEEQEIVWQIETDGDGIASLIYGIKPDDFSEGVAPKELTIGKKYEIRVSGWGGYGGTEFDLAITDANSPSE